MSRVLAKHWPEYMIEAAGLGLFMVSAGLSGTLFEYPGSPVRQAIAEPMARQLLTGLAMGATAVAIIYSRWGQRSGAHINPAITLTFLRLGKIERRDAGFYVAAQFVGAIAGVMLVYALLGAAFANPPVRYVATVPGARGAGTAFAAEAGISFVLMLTVLTTMNDRRLARYTGLCAGMLVATYITIESPLSGMSMNPARTFGSALPPRLWSTLWLYFTAPLIGMFLAAELYVRVRGRDGVHCAKLRHPDGGPCIFRCDHPTAEVAFEPPSAAPAGPIAPAAVS